MSRKDNLARVLWIGIPILVMQVITPALAQAPLEPLPPAPAPSPGVDVPWVVAGAVLLVGAVWLFLRARRASK
jgi:hypothetical protein